MDTAMAKNAAETLQAVYCLRVPRPRLCKLSAETLWESGLKNSKPVSYPYAWAAAPPTMTDPSWLA